MVGLRCWLALALLLLGSTPNCLGQDDPGPPGEGPDGPPPDSARSVRRQDEGPQGEAPQGEGPNGNPPENRILDSFISSREGSLREREEEVLEERAYGKGAWQTRLGKKCKKGTGEGYEGCNRYPGSTFIAIYLWCYTEGSTEWESCCSWNCRLYEPGWGGSPYYYCYTNDNGGAWDYCDPDTYAG